MKFNEWSYSEVSLDVLVGTDNLLLHQVLLDFVEIEAWGVIPKYISFGSKYLKSPLLFPQLLMQ